MKTVRKITQHPMMIILLLISILNISCNQDDYVDSQIQSISGEELFKSVFFADGIATKNLPSLKKYMPKNLDFTKEQLIEYRQIQEKTIYYLNSLDANYMDAFKSNMLSHNPEMVSKELTKVGEDMYSYFKTELGKKNVDLDRLVNEYNNNSIDISNAEDGVALVFIITVVIALGVVVAATIAYTKVDVQGGGTSKGPVIMTKGSLTKDLFVAEIVNNL